MKWNNNNKSECDICENPFQSTGGHANLFHAFVTFHANNMMIFWCRLAIDNVCIQFMLWIYVANRCCYKPKNFKVI